MLGGSVLWFRHGLRLHDNPSLQSALEDRRVPFFPVFIFDGETAGTIVGYNRMLYHDAEALNDLDVQFRMYGGKLLMIKGKPDDIFKRLWEEFGIRKLCFEQDCKQIWRQRDESVRAMCRDIGVSCREHVSHTSWNPYTIIHANGGIPPLTYQMFLVTKPEDFGVFLENEDIRMTRWVGCETAASNQMQNRLAVEYETFCR